MSKLKNCLRSERINIFKNGQMRQIFQKTFIYLLASVFTGNANILGTFLPRFVFEMEVNLIND